MVPVEQHRREAGEEPVGDGPGAVDGRGIAAGGGQFFGFEVAEHGAAGAEDVHRMRRGGDLLEHGAKRGREAAETDEFRAVGGEFGGAGQAFMDEQVGDLLEGGVGGDLGDVIAAIVEVVAGLADGANGGAARHDAGEGDGFLGLAGRRGRGAHAEAGSREWGARSYWGGV